METNQLRCAGCGKVIQPADPTARVAMGVTSASNVFQEKEEWGILHRSCFNRAIGSPEAILEEIRTLREARKKAK